MDHKIYVIEQHPLRLLIPLNLIGTKAVLFQPQFHFVRNSLHLPRIAPAAHHEVIGKGAGPLLQFEYGNFFCLFFQAGL